MSDPSLPADVKPLSVFAYFQESLRAWGAFSETTSRLMAARLQDGFPKLTTPVSLDADDEPLPGELLRAMSDLNLRHWQNTARFLEGLPSWMRVPQNVSGAALVDWFDRINRLQTAAPDLQSGTDLPVAGAARPIFLNAPEGQADDLTRIKGIGKKLSALLNELGIYHFRQIADWSDAEAAWIDDYLAFKGRVGRENWIAQARTFSLGGAASTALH